MKWIAIEIDNGEGSRIVSVEDVEYFFSTRGGEGLYASMKNGKAHAVVTDEKPFLAGSPAAILLAQLNGPVGEVPYK